jgi:hypothetical protein
VLRQAPCTPMHGARVGVRERPGSALLHGPKRVYREGRRLLGAPICANHNV